MDWGDYLRDEAAKYRQLAETAKDPLVQKRPKIHSSSKSFSIWQPFVRRFKGFLLFFFK
jgi:hypothetical protein